MSAQEAKDFGLVDEVVKNQPAAAQAKDEAAKTRIQRRLNSSLPTVSENPAPPLPAKAGFFSFLTCRGVKIDPNLVRVFRSKGLKYL